MREFKKRRSSRAELMNFGMRLAGTLLLLCLTVLMVRAAWDMYRRVTIATAGQQEAEANLATLEAQKTTISASVAQLSSARGQEAILREHYGVVRPGEGVVQIVDNASTTPEAAGSRSWLRNLFHVLFSW